MSEFRSNSFDLCDQYGVNIGLPLPLNIKSDLYYTYLNMGESGGTSSYQLSLARTFYHIAFGTSVRYMSQSMNDNTGIELESSGWFFDIGIRYERNLFSNQNSKIDFHFGGTIYNLGPSSQFEKTSLYDAPVKREEPHARVVQSGLAFQADFLKESDHAIKPEILFSLENRRLLNTNRYEKWNYMISGGELRLFKMALVRLGYCHRITGCYNESGWSYGVGFETKKPLSEKLPVRAGLSYSRSLKIGQLSRDVFQMELNFRSE